MTTPYDTPQHVRGQSRFLDDLPQPQGCLHAAIVPSAVACGDLRDVDTSLALRMDGVVAVLTADDIPSQNQIGTVIQDEPLLAQDEVHFMGQPVALVVARSPRLARQAAKAVKPRIDICKPVFDPREAAALGRFIAPSRTLALGDVDAAWSTCAHVVTGRADSGGQEHLYLEPQGALALPQEKGGVQIYSSTQSPTAVQRVTASVLGLAMHDVQVEVGRLGGGFGGKEDQATAYAALASLAAFRTGKPVKLVLERHEDMRLTGKRHPYSSDFKLGLDAEGRILAYEVTFYQDAGAAADLSTAILERSLYHATGAYFVPNARVTGHSCRTNHVPNTAFRGFGGPQAMFVMESAIAMAAEHMNLPAWQIQERNLLQEGDRFPYGAQAEQCHAQRSFKEAKDRFEWERVLAETAAFNQSHSLMKKGAALMPICFGISFTTTFLNQAGSLVHVYTDGSVSVATAAVEMGQGVHAKVRRIVALALGVDESLVTLQPTSTRTVANTSPTAASTATDLNGAAARLAALAIRERLLTVAGSLLNSSAETLDLREGRVWQGDRDAGLAWTDLVQAAYQRRVDLSAHALYATPGIHYDKKEEKGRPFAYHVYGTALVTATVDVLRGTAAIDAVRMLHDAGRSLDPLIDQGQAEGALVQGLGWMTSEELVYAEDGRLLSDSLTTYKVPDLHAMPQMEVVFLEDADNPHAVLSTKGIGEPPFLYGIGGFFAIQNAIQAARPDQPLQFHAPLTHERIFTLLHGAGDDAV